MNKEELLVIEPIIGYRFWDIYCEKKNGKYTFRLQGVGAGNVVNKGDIWDRGINIAKCLRDKPIVEIDGKIIKQKHKVPEFKCQCGFYFYKYKIDLIKLLLDNQFPNNLLCGMAELTGKVIEHSTGYRAEKAKIKKLIWCKDEDNINLSYEDKDKKEEKKEEEEKQIDSPNLIQQLTATQNAYYQQYNYQIRQRGLPIPQSIYQRINPSFISFDDLSTEHAKTFTKDKILKQISDYYQVPIIYYKDYLEKELLR